MRGDVAIPMMAFLLLPLDGLAFALPFSLKLAAEIEAQTKEPHTHGGRGAVSTAFMHHHSHQLLVIFQILPYLIFPSAGAALCDARNQAAGSRVLTGSRSRPCKSWRYAATATSEMPSVCSNS